MMIKTEGKKIFIDTPYHPEFVKGIKKIGNAKWNGSKWVATVDAIEDVRKLMLDVYGDNDVTIPRRIKVILTAKRMIYADRSGIYALGKNIASASGRDSGALVGKDVILRSGNVDSAGSRANWYTRLDEGSVVVLNNVSELIYNASKEKLSEDYDIEVQEYTDLSEIKALLLDEKAKLQERLQEIDKLLDTSNILAV